MFLCFSRRIAAISCSSCRACCSRPTPGSSLAANSPPDSSSWIMNTSPEEPAPMRLPSTHEPSTTLPSSSSLCPQSTSSCEDCQRGDCTAAEYVPLPASLVGANEPSTSSTTSKPRVFCGDALLLRSLPRYTGGSVDAADSDARILVSKAAMRACVSWKESSSAVSRDAHCGVSPCPSAAIISKKAEKSSTAASCPSSRSRDASVHLPCSAACSHACASDAIEWPSGASSPSRWREVSRSNSRCSPISASG
mmetsp:Transcript_30363/g.73869  ORF Transcript_30363/g.73869 Transcript_30363/m.73869 type:complete len:251 (-) Transcript_30363:197-949(-)